MQHCMFVIRVVGNSSFIVMKLLRPKYMYIQYTVYMYRRIRLSGAHCYLAHTAYQAYAVFLTKSIQTLDKKRTALIERNLEWVRRNIQQLDQIRASTQCERGSLCNGDHFAIASQKCARHVKRTMKISDTALLFWLNHSPSPFSTCSSTASFC